nr:hypothetical protein JVH1_1103 [Rhodococcus sp. JVH1]
MEQGEDPSRLTERATPTAQAPQPNPADLDEAIGFWTCSIRDTTRSSVAEGVLSSLLVVLDFRDRTRGRTVGVLPGVLAGAALAEQVPALIKCYLDPTELVAFLAGGQFAGLDPVPQLMLAGDEGLDLRERVWLIHHISVVSVVAAVIVECWNRDSPKWTSKICQPFGGTRHRGCGDWARLDVPVQDGRTVRSLQRPRQLYADPDHLAPGHRTLPTHSRVQRAPLMMLHHNERAPRRGCADAQHIDYIRMP